MGGAPSVSDATAAVEFLEARRLGSFAARIVEVTDAETVADLKLMSAANTEDVILAVDMDPSAAEKFRAAMAELLGGVPDTLGPASSSSSRTKAQEFVVVCVDRSGSMGSKFNETTVNVVEGAVMQRSRMEAVKAMFYAYRDRVDAIEGASFQLGLVEFNQSANEMLGLTPELDKFESIVDDMRAGGGTAIYSALIMAAQMLKKHFRRKSQIDLRVLALTDGRSTTGAPPEEALAALNEIGAVVDAIIVGSSPDANLRKIVSATEGECFQINDLGEGFELLEAEGAVSLRARRGGADKPPFKRREAIQFSSIEEKAMTQGSAVQRAPVVPQDLAAAKVVDVAVALRGAEASAAGGGPAIKRLLQELRNAQRDGGSDGIHVFPSEESLLYWRVLVEGPPGTPFEGGVFLLNVQFPTDYPCKAPKVTFQTPIYHCNVNDSGSLCLDILKEKWSPALTLREVLLNVRSMMIDPNPHDALRQWIAELTLAHVNSKGSDTRYFEKAREHTQKNASTSVDAWKEKWGC